MIIGITGGIGTGKSTVLDILGKKHGYIIFEADKLAHELMSKGNMAYNRITDCFGEGILDEEGNIDRSRFGKIVFADREKLAQLNHIVHPAVIEEISRRIDTLRQSGHEKFVIEAALLIESGCHKICDRVWYIDTEKNIRIDRLKKNRNMSDEQIENVMKNQLDKDDFLKAADAVLDNSGSIENTEKQIQNLLEF